MEGLKSSLIFTVPVFSALFWRFRARAHDGDRRSSVRRSIYLPLRHKRARRNSCIRKYAVNSDSKRPPAQHANGWSNSVTQSEGVIQGWMKRVMFTTATNSDIWEMKRSACGGVQRGAVLAPVLQCVAHVSRQMWRTSEVSWYVDITQIMALKACQKTHFALLFYSRGLKFSAAV